MFSLNWTRKVNDTHISFGNTCVEVIVSVVEQDVLAFLNKVFMLLLYV